MPFVGGKHLTFITPPMSLAAHSRLDTYEIVAPLGAGAMGEVYRVRDATAKEPQPRWLGDWARHIKGELVTVM